VALYTTANFLFPFMFTAILPRLLQNETDSGISYPNQHIDSDCFLRIYLFSSSTAHDTHWTIMSSSDMELLHTRLLVEGMHYEHFTHPLLC
jgi:hypothetical protein